MMMGDIERNRSDISAMQTRVSNVEEAVQDQAVSMARIDENIKAIRDSVERMANARQ